MSDQPIKPIPGNEDPERQDLAFTLPKGVINDLDLGCSSYLPAWHAPFQAQVTPPFDRNQYNPYTAAWCINAVIYAYQQYCNKEKSDVYPPDVVDGTPLYWHEDFNLLNKKIPCGFIGKIKETNSAVIALRGTEKVSEWLENFQYQQKSITFPAPIGTTANIHKGFWEVLNEPANSHTLSLQQQIMDWLNINNPTELYITGHSLGAAIATLVLIHSLLHYRPPGIKIYCYIIGSPRVGDIIFSDAFRSLSNNPDFDFAFWRMVNIEDVVPTIPLPVFDKIVYTHIFSSPAGSPNTIGEVSFIENLGDLGKNHNPLTYFFADRTLMPDPSLYT